MTDVVVAADGRALNSLTAPKKEVEHIGGCDMRIHNSARREILGFTDLQAWLSAAHSCIVVLRRHDVCNSGTKIIVEKPT